MAWSADPNPNRTEGVWDRFSGGEDTNLLFNYFEVSNERIRETGMRNSAVKCGEKTVSYYRA